MGALWSLDIFSKSCPATEGDIRDVVWVRSLNQEDPLEKEMATYSSILA